MHANGKRALVGAMSALMVATSMPAPALAAEVAGLGLQQPAAREQTAAAPAAEQKENASQQGKGQKAQAQDSTSSATQPGASGKTEAKNPASSAAAKRGQSAPAASAAQAVGKGQAAAAVAKPVEEPKAVQTAPQAPKFDLDQAANTYGMVSYEVQKADGTTECSESAIIGKDNVKSVSEPKQNADGSWTVTVTLKDGLTAANFNVPSWALSVDPSEYAVDPSASKLTVEFSTEPNGTSYSASGDARAKLVFKQAPAEQAPAAPTADWVATKANSYGAVDWKGDADQIFGGYLPAGTFTVGKVQKADDGSYYVDVTLNKDKASIDKVFSEGSEGDLKTYQFDADAQGNSYVVRFNWNKNTKVWELDTAHVATLTYNYNKPSIEWKNIDPAGVVGFRIDGDPADATVALKEGTYTSTGMSPNGDGTFSMSCELKEDSLQGYIDELNQQTGKHYVLADDADTTPFFSLRAAAGDKFKVGVKAEIEVEEAAPAPVAATVHIHLTDEASDRVVNAHVGDKLSSLDGWQESPKRDGYTFKGWNTKADGTGDTVTGDTKVPTPYFSVWAQWEPKAQAKIEAQDATITADQIAGKDWDEQVAMARKALVKSATDASGKDAKGDVELTFMKDGSNGWYAFSQAETGDYQVVLTLGGVSKTVKLTVEEAEPQAPAVDVSQLLNTYGTVSYKVQGGTQDGSAPYLDATKVDATAGTPEKQVDGTWRVTLKLKANDKLATALLVHDWELPEGTTADDFQVDEQGSTLTATFETTSPTGTSWYLVPGQGIEVSFVKKAVRATVHLFYGFKSDEHPTSDGEVVLSSGNVGDKLSTLYSWEETPTRDGYTFKGWNTKADGTGETVTGATAIPTGWYALYAQWEKKAAPANPSKPGQGEQGGTTTPEQKPEQGPAGTANKMDGKDGVRAPAQKKAAAEKSSKDGNALPQTGDSSMTVVSAAAVAGVAALVGGAEILRRRAQN